MAAAASVGGKVRDLMNLIRFEHTLFALPFAAAGALLGADGLPARPAPDLPRAWANWERATAAVADEQTQAEALAA